MALSQLKKDDFVNISKYREYYEFRLKNESFMEHIQQSKEITFDRSSFIECLNTAFKEGTQPSKKNYKKILADKEQREI